MNIQIKHILIALVLLCGVRAANVEAAGPTIVTNPLQPDFKGEVHWIETESPYIMNGDIFVDPGVKLIIDPGVIVKFDGDFDLSILGEIYARGLAQKRIVFTSNFLNPQPGAWGKIIFAKGSIGASYNQNYNYTKGSIIEYAEIKYGDGLKIDSSPFISNNIIQFISNEQSGAIFLGNSASSVIRDNSVRENLTSGIYSSHGLAPLYIIHNEIIDNERISGFLGTFEAAGLNLIFHTPRNGISVIEENIITNNKAEGIVSGGVTLFNSNNFHFQKNIIKANTVESGLNRAIRYASALWMSGVGSSKITCNTIADNKTINPRNGSSAIVQSGTLSSSASIKKNTFSNPSEDFEFYMNNTNGNSIILRDNFWGTAVKQIIEERIWDFYNNQNEGVVFYDKFLTQEDPCTKPMKPCAAAPGVCDPVNPPVPMCGPNDVQGFDTCGDICLIKIPECPCVPDVGVCNPIHPPVPICGKDVKGINTCGDMCIIDVPECPCKPIPGFCDTNGIKPKKCGDFVYGKDSCEKLCKDERLCPRMALPCKIFPFLCIDETIGKDSSDEPSQAKPIESGSSLEIQESGAIKKPLKTKPVKKKSSYIEFIGN